MEGFAGPQRQHAGRQLHRDGTGASVRGRQSVRLVLDERLRRLHCARILASTGADQHSDADTYAHAYAYADADAYTHAHAYADAHTYADSNADCHANAAAHREPGAGAGRRRL
jgi:hypothetical protein